MTEENHEHILDKINRLFNAANPRQKEKPKYDLLKPPGLVGDVVDYINSQCRYPRENLAVISALVTIGNIGGLTHKLENNKLSSNIFAFCVAGSATGKEAILQAVNDLHIAAGISAAVHGSIKSEQEIIRNLIRHQAAYYNIDEFGIFLKKLSNSGKSGGASYLQGVVGLLMSAYSKSGGNLLLSGDLKDEVREKLGKEIAQLNKKLDSMGSNAAIEQKIAYLCEACESLDKGLPCPFLSLIGFTTPSTFNESVSFEQITSGFIGRSIIINEPDNNPKPSWEFDCPGMPDHLQTRLLALRSTGEFNVMDGSRIESSGTYTTICIDDGAKERIRECADWFWQKAEEHSEKTGFEAVVRRGNELMLKIAYILSLGSTTMTTDSVNWAFEYIKRDIELKTLLAYSNDKEKSSPIKSMQAKILASAGTDGITVGKLVNKYRSKKSVVESAIEALVEVDKIYVVESMHKINNSLIKTVYIKD
jgi:hypothetical protein